MFSNTTMFLWTLAEMGLALFLAARYLRSQEMRQRFSAVIVYFFLRAAETACGCSYYLAREAKSNGVLFHFTAGQLYAMYFYAYWSLFLIGAVAIFWMLLQLYSEAMSPLPGLRSLGRGVFYWAGAASLLMAFVGGLVPLHLQMSPRMLSQLGLSIMRCISVFEICLLALLCVSIHKLGLSFKSRIWGLTLGLGVYSVYYLLLSIFAPYTSNLNGFLAVSEEVCEVAGLLVWLVYSFLSEPERKPIMLPVTSPLIRWNEIALALGFGEAKVALGGSPSSFYVPQVEKAVEEAMGRAELKKSIQQSI